MSEDNKALVPIAEQQIIFYEDEITAAVVEIDEKQKIFVPIKPICDYLGLTWASQLLRIKRDAVLSEAQGMFIMNTPKGSQGMVCLPLEYLNGWLFGITPGKVKPDLKEKVIRYQRECYLVLSQHFQAEAMSAAVPVPSNNSNTGLIQIRQMALAIAEMAEQQIELEQSVNRAHDRLDQAAIVVKELQRRVGGIEKRLTPASLITEEQATEVSQAVKALAEYLTSQDKSKNHYQAVFQEIYRRYGVSSYKNIRADQFGAVLKFLEEWREKGN